MLKLKTIYVIGQRMILWPTKQIGINLRLEVACLCQIILKSAHKYRNYGPDKSGCTMASPAKNSLLQAISPFPTKFSKGLCHRHIKHRFLWEGFSGNHSGKVTKC